MMSGSLVERPLLGAEAVAAMRRSDIALGPHQDAARFRAAFRVERVEQDDARRCAERQRTRHPVNRVSALRSAWSGGECRSRRLASAPRDRRAAGGRVRVSAFLWLSPLAIITTGSMMIRLTPPSSAQTSVRASMSSDGSKPRVLAVLLDALDERDVRPVAASGHESAASACRRWRPRRSTRRRCPARSASRPATGRRPSPRRRSQSRSSS